MSALPNEKVFCSPHHMVIDLAIEQEDGTLIGMYSHETVDQLGQRYPGIFIDTLENSVKRQEDAHKTAPVEITEAQFYEALECLPPINWIHKGDSETFKMSEFVSGRITGIYARIGKRHFRFNDVNSMKHVEIIEKITETIQTIH